MDIIRIFVPEACEQEASPVGCGGPVPIGYVGESGVRQVVLDFSPWVETYGPGALTLMVRRNGDADAYPVTLEIDDSTAAWTVSNVDTHTYGVGRAQYMYVVDGENVKSAIFQTFVDKSVTQPGSDPPDPYEGWVQHLTELGAETLRNAQDAQEAADAAETAKTDAAQSAETAGNEADRAENARQSVEDLGVTAHEDPSGPSVVKIVNPETGAVTLNFGFKPAGVTEVNGQTGVVTLDAEAVGALPDRTTLDDIPDGATYKRPTAAQVQQISANAAAITLKQAIINASGILNGNGNGQISAAVAGMDYATPAQVAAKYTKPAGGIPATDMSQAVQTSLDKADTALQEHQSLAAYRSAAAQDVIDAAQDEEIADLKSAVFDWVPVNLKIAFAQGAFNSSGKGVASNYYSRSSVWFDTLTTAYKIVPKNGCKLRAFYYTAPDLNNFDHRSDEFTSATTLEKGYYVRLVAGNTEGTAFTPAEGLRSFVAYEYSSKAQDEDEIDAICSNEAEALKYAIGSNAACINATDGSASSVTGYSRTDFVDISNFDYVVFTNVQFDASATQFGAAFYADAAAGTFISGVFADILADVVSYKPVVVKVPDGAKYVRFTLVQSLDGFFIKGIRKKPLSGLYLSLLGDSMSAGDSNSPGGAMKTSAGGLYTPSGNDMYYNGSRGGVTNISEMWWMRLCNETGMIPLVIDAWSGSAICYNYAHDSTHSDTSKIPMCSAERTGRLAKNGQSPDMIIIAGGGNDWSYAADASGSTPATTPLGNWDGHSAVSSTDVFGGTSTFMESYAFMIKELQTNYPNAIIVCSSVWKNTGRGTSTGLVRLNAVGNSAPDYSNAIEKVCKIMSVPFIDVSDIGITEENAYPTYCEDSSSEPTHTNPLGQAVIAKRYIDVLPGLVRQLK